MDDDLMSLRGGGLSPSGGDSIPDENPLGLGLDDFTPAPPPPAPATPAASAAPAAPAIPAGKPKAAEPASKKKPDSKPKPAPKPKRASKGGGGFMGLSPQQGMLLSIFLFLDVAVLGCLILFALGAIGR